MNMTKDMAKLLGLSIADTKIINNLNEGMTVSEIASAAKIPRTSLYYTLRKLTERGFVYSRMVRKKEMWFKSSHEDFSKKYIDAIQSMGSPTPSLNSISQAHIYTGSSNLMNVFWDITNLAPGSRFYCIQPRRSLVNVLKKTDLEDVIIFNNSVKRKNLIIEGIIHETGTVDMVKVIDQKNQKAFLESFFGRAADTVKMPENFLSTTEAEFYIYKNKLAIVNWKKEYAVIIDDKDVFELILEMFKSTKYMLEKYDQNEKIAKLLVDET